MAADSPLIPLAARRLDAARMLGVSPRTLDRLTVPHGPIPCARIGAAKVYLIPDLQDFLTRARIATGTSHALAKETN
jgi:hypothetical protein